MVGVQIVQVCCGGNSTGAVSSEGVFYAWGYNKYGQCGSLTEAAPSNCTDGITEPNPVKIPSRSPIIFAAMGQAYTMVVTKDLQLFSCGSNEYGQLGRPDMKAGDENCNSFEMKPVEMAGMGEVSQICCGRHHTVALTKSKAVYVWGRSDNGRLGLGRIKENFRLPRLLPFPVDHSGKAPKISRIITGDGTNFALTETGRVYSWGINKYGQCGYFPPTGRNSNSDACQTTPRLLEHIRGVNNISIGGCSAGFTIYIVSGLRQILHQHIRDFNISEVRRIVNMAVPVLLSRKPPFQFVVFDNIKYSLFWIIRKRRRRNGRHPHCCQLGCF